MTQFTRPTHTDRYFMLDQARALRRQMSKPKRLFWYLVKGKRCGGFKFRRQHVIGAYIVDFYCPARSMVVEIDGQEHDPVKDAERDKVLADYGLRVLRFSNAEVYASPDGVVRKVLSELIRNPDICNVSPPGPLP